MSALLKKHSFNDVFDSQSVFRLLLEAMSNPARIVSVKSYADKMQGDIPAMLALAVTLLDNEVCFSVCENRSLSQEILSLTLAKSTVPAFADYIFVCTVSDLPLVIQKAKCGTLSEPHDSATIIVKNDGLPVCPLVLSGPGINGQIIIQVSQLVLEALKLRTQQCYETPRGIDLIFIHSNGKLFAVPRTVRWEVA